MRFLPTLILAVACSIVVSAQQRPQPAPAAPEVKVVTSSDLAAIIAAQPKDKNGTASFIQLPPYNVTMEHRLKEQAASLHETDAELFYVVDGAGSLVTGGKLTGEQRANPANLTGTGIEGGVTRKLAKGDWALVPPGVAHWFPDVAPGGGLTLMALKLPRP